MSIIDRYVLRQLLPPMLLALLVFTFVLLIPGLIEHAEAFIAKGVTPMVVGTAMLTLVPAALALTIPMSVLVGLLVAFARLSSDREFVAMQACGLSLVRLLRPVGLVAVLAWAATSYVYLVAVPESNQAFREIAFNVLASKAEGEVRPRAFFDEFPNLVLYVQDVPATGGGWNGVFMSDRRGGSSAVYVARHGRVAIDRQKRTVEMLLESGARHTTDAKGAYEVFQFDRLVIGLDPETYFPREGPQKGVNELTIAELRQRIDELQKQGQSPHNEQMKIHQKFSIPVACLVFGLIGIALGASNRRDGALGSFAQGLVVIFLYYVPMYLGPALTKGGLISPWLAAWLPNIVLGIVGLFLFRWRGRAADRPLRIPLPKWRRLGAAGTGTRGYGHVAAGSAGPVRLLDRYVASAYVRVFGLAALALAGIFYISTFLDLSDKVFKGDATWRMLGTYFVYITPQYAYYILPLAVLLAALVTIGVLTKNNELIVMKACGISLYRVAVPMLVCAAVTGSLLFALEESVLGAANREAERLRSIIRSGVAYTGVANRQWSDSDRWTLERGWRREFRPDGAAAQFTSFESQSRHMTRPAVFVADQPDARFMGYRQLKVYADELRRSGLDVLGLEVALARKLSFPFVTVIMTLIAVPFAVLTGHRGAMAGIGVGIGLAMTYWTTISVCAAMGAGGMMPPTIAAWAPNAIFGAGAAYLLLSVRT
jgi:LPS export ABC transporter permease LptF